MKKRILLGMLIGCMAVALATGCGSKQEESTDTEETVETTSKEAEAAKVTTEELKTIGTKTDGAYEIKLTNATGKKITGVSAKTSADAEYPANFLTANDAFANDETRLLYFKPTTTEPTATESGKLMSMEYTIQLTFEDGTTAVLHGFPLDDIEEGTVKLEDNIAYIEYKSKSSGNTVVTLETEKANQAAAEAQAAAQAAATETTDTSSETYEETTDDTYYEETTDDTYYEETTDDTYYEDTSSDTTDDSTDDTDDSAGCVTDGLTF